MDHKKSADSREDKPKRGKMPYYKFFFAGACGSVQGIARGHNKTEICEDIVSYAEQFCPHELPMIGGIKLYRQKFYFRNVLFMSDSADKNWDPSNED